MLKILGETPMPFPQTPSHKLCQNLKGGDVMNMKLEQEIYVGLDTHRNTIHGTAMNKKGEVIRSDNFSNDKETLQDFMKDFPTWNTVIAIEACNFWRGCYKILTEKGFKVKLANPVTCHKIAHEKKTDKVDSKILADLSRVNYLPEVYIPSDEICELRDLTRHKMNFTRFKVRIQNKIKSCLSRNGISYKDELWTKDGICWLNEQKSDEINSLLKLYETIKTEEEAIKQKIEKVSSAKKETSLLETIPGIGYFGATLIYAEIGNIERFPTVKHLHAYAGAAPGIYQSGTKTRMPTRKSVNYWLKWITMQCAGRLTLKNTKPNKLRNYYFKVRDKKGWKTARKATARKLLTVIWYVLHEKIPYRES